MSLSPKDMDFIEAKHTAAREIALALGVPPMLLGIPGDNTYSNYQEATRSLWRQTVLPLATRTAKALSTWLSPAYGAPLELRPDYDAIEALTPEREALWSRVDKATFLTPNEKRAAVGYGPTEGSDPAGLTPSRHALDGGDLSYKYPGQPRTSGGQLELRQGRPTAPSQRAAGYDLPPSLLVHLRRRPQPTSLRPSTPGTGTPPSRPFGPREAIDLYRSTHDVPAGQGTVAFAEVDRCALYWSQRQSAGLPDSDRNAADQIRDTLLARYER